MVITKMSIVVIKFVIPLHYHLNSTITYQKQLFFLTLQYEGNKVKDVCYKFLCFNNVTEILNTIYSLNIY